MRIRQMGFSSRLKAHRHLLTLESLKFIVEYLADGDTKGAAIRSGIPETYASRQGQWLKKLPKVKEALAADLTESDLRKLQANIRLIEEKMHECKVLLGVDE
jgi:phage terminase small subunit